MSIHVRSSFYLSISHQAVDEVAITPIRAVKAQTKHQLELH